ncbi:MAG: hypothetical protein R3208_18525 [Ketobacteraceae bacterium]|nr:hypothetical protein [Ketobacteraceae bacterium]
MSLLDRTITFKTAIGAVATTVVIYLCILLLFYGFVSDRLLAQFTLDEVPIAIQLPKFMPVTSVVHNELRAELDDVLDVTVPVDQWINARFPRRFPVEVSLNTMVQLKTSVRYTAVIPVSAMFELRVPIQNPVAPVTVPVRLPLSFEVPVDFTIPVDHQLPVNLTTGVIAAVPDPVPVHLRAALRSRVPLDTQLDARVLTKAEAHLMFPTTPVDLSLTHTDLGLNLGDISLVRRSLGYPAAVTNQQKTGMTPKALIYVYDAAKQPPEWQ